MEYIKSPSIVKFTIHNGIYSLQFVKKIGRTKGFGGQKQTPQIDNKHGSDYLASRFFTNEFNQQIRTSTRTVKSQSEEWRLSKNYAC